MQNAINTKLLIAILVALAAISAVLVTIHQSQVRAAIVQQQQQKQEDDFRSQVEALKKKHSSAAGNESKTWQTYIP